MLHRYILLVICLFAGGSDVLAQAEKIKGITMVAPPHKWDEPPIVGLEKLNTEWVSLVPYGFTRPGTTDVLHNLEWQWWGEREPGVISSAKMAHANGIRVMLKPQVYIPGSWVGDLDYESEEEWVAWEQSYTDFITYWARLAEKLDIHVLCLGTEYKIAQRKRPEYWRNLVAELRDIYSGQLTYSANWDSYPDCPIWDLVDYIGVSAYFPLSDATTPQVDQLQKKWRPIVKDLNKFSQQYNKPILFTEYGYMSVDGAAGKAWMIEKDLGNRSINEKAQANAYDALLSSVMQQDWWAGGFLWKFFPHGQGHEGYPEKDYTPQGKKASAVIARWYAF